MSSSSASAASLPPLMPATPASSQGIHHVDIGFCSRLVGRSRSALPKMLSHQVESNEPVTSATLQLETNNSSSLGSPSKRSSVVPPINSIGTMSFVDKFAGMSLDNIKSNFGNKGGINAGNNNNGDNNDNIEDESGASSSAAATASAGGRASSSDASSSELWSPRSSGSGSGGNDSQPPPSNYCFFVRNTVVYLRDGVAMEPKTKRTKSKGSTSSEPLNSIPESDVLNEPFRERPVTIISMINGQPEGSNAAAEFVARTLHQRITSHVDFTSMANMPAVLRESFQDVDQAFQESVGENAELGTLNSCCFVVTIVISEDDVCTANLGLSRGVIMGNNGKAIQISNDHLASSEEESARIKAIPGCRLVNGKINGMKRFSRSMGDVWFKRRYPGSIISLPSVCHFRVTPPKRLKSIAASNTAIVAMPKRTSIMGRLLGVKKSERRSSNLEKKKVPSEAKANIEPDLFLILGSSVVWDVMSNNEACRYIDLFIRKQQETSATAHISQRASEYLLRKVVKLAKKSRGFLETSTVSVCVVRWMEFEE